MNAYANMNTRNIQNKANFSSGMSEKEKENAYKNAMEQQNVTKAKPGSMRAKANMVKDYNERNNGNKG